MSYFLANKNARCLRCLFFSGDVPGGLYSTCVALPWWKKISDPNSHVCSLGRWVLRLENSATWIGGLTDIEEKHEILDPRKGGDLQ